MDCIFQISKNCQYHSEFIGRTRNKVSRLKKKIDICFFYYFFLSDCGIFLVRNMNSTYLNMIEKRTDYLNSIVKEYIAMLFGNAFLLVSIIHNFFLTGRDYLIFTLLYTAVLDPAFNFCVHVFYRENK